jgi:GT2 family glycosyltransferase
MQSTNIHASTSRPRVSVILPTYNRAGIISKCIDSVLLQSYNDWELIICDDCSTDKHHGLQKNLRNWATGENDIHIFDSVAIYIGMSKLN